MVDTGDLKSPALMSVRVRLPPRLPLWQNEGKMTNRTDMWENQVELLTRHCQTLTEQIDRLEERLTYFEGVVLTLIVALKENGVIVDASEESTDPTYEM